MTIPVIDLAPARHGSAADRRRLAVMVDAACRETGFFGIVGHGIDEEMLDRSWRDATAFFDLPLDERLTVREPYPGYPYGYRPFAAETLDRSLGEYGGAADLKETLNIGPVDAPPRPIEQMTDPDERAVYAPNLWPDYVMPQLRVTFSAYYRQMSTLAAELMSVFAQSLDLAPGWFDRFIDRHGSALRLAHYPALDRPLIAGQMRASAHTDYGTLTILRADDEHPGLQVQTSAGEWIDVPAVPGGFVVNLGDLMARWTNDRWRSTMHRVVVAEGESRERRLSIPFFHNANWDAVITCIPTCVGAGARYEPVVAGPHLMSKFRATVT
jgi:isopenicillin N synthase-like dioxygenase